MRKKIIGTLIVAGIIALNFKGLILGAMELADYVGEKNDMNVVTTIDNLNTIYYMLYEN